MRDIYVMSSGRAKLSHPRHPLSTSALRNAQAMADCASARAARERSITNWPPLSSLLRSGRRCVRAVYLDLSARYLAVWSLLRKRSGWWSNNCYQIRRWELLISYDRPGSRRTTRADDKSTSTVPHDDTSRFHLISFCTLPSKGKSGLG